MTDVELVAAIRCIGTDKNSYRIYVDNDLITERTFIWDKDQTYISEHIFVSLSPGAHEIKVETVQSESDFFRIIHLECENKLLELTKGVFILD